MEACLCISPKEDWILLIGRITAFMVMLLDETYF
jgi:hypothetical protein